MKQKKTACQSDLAGTGTPVRVGRVGLLYSSELRRSDLTASGWLRTPVDPELTWLESYRTAAVAGKALSCCISIGPPQLE
jgi:hypothetical protein